MNKHRKIFQVRIYPKNVDVKVFRPKRYLTSPKASGSINVSCNHPIRKHNFFCKRFGIFIKVDLCIISFVIISWSFHFFHNIRFWITALLNAFLMRTFYAAAFGEKWKLATLHQKALRKVCRREATYYTFVERIDAS